MPNDLHTLIETATTGNGRSTRVPIGPREQLRRLSRYWWLELVAGVAWLAMSVVVLRFDHAAVVTVGVLTGVMFLIFAAEQFALAWLDRQAGWAWAIFGVLMAASGVVALVDPVATFAGLADILGIVFLLIGVQWMVRAFIERVVNDLWWLNLISGILMVGLGFWTSGQFFLTRASMLLVFAGIWAAMKGVTDIVRAFQIRRLGS